MRTLLGLVLVASVGLIACSGDGGSGGSGGSGGNGGEFHLNDVTLAYTEVPDGIKKSSLFFSIGWANCPSNLDCNEDLTIEIATPAAAVDIGPPSSWMSLPQNTLDAVGQILASNPTEVYLNWELSRDSYQMGGTWGPIVCPAKFDITAPAPTDVVTTPGSLLVSWTPFDRVAPDSGQTLAANNCAVTAIEWDDDLNNNNGVVQNKQTTADATSITLDLSAKYPISDRLLIEVTAAGRVYEDQWGGEGYCNYARSVIVDLQ